MKTDLERSRLGDFLGDHQEAQFGKKKIIKKRERSKCQNIGNHQKYRKPSKILEQKIGNIRNTGKYENMENMETMENIEHIENIEKTENSENH